jgi:hypothetical protein
VGDAGQSGCFARTAPAAPLEHSSEHARLLTEPMYCAMLLLQQFENSSAILQSEVLVGLALRCACQISLDQRRLEGMTKGGIDTHLSHTYSRGGFCDPHLLRRVSAVTDEASSPHHSAVAALRNIANSSMLPEMENRMMYITDSHVEDSGVKDGTALSQVCLFSLSSLFNHSSIQPRALPLKASNHKSAE